MTTYDKYKESGIEWIGDIPQHWEVRRIKEIFKEFGSGTTPNTSITSYYDEGTIDWLNTTDIKNNTVLSTKYKITKKALSDYKLKIFPENSLAIGMYGQGQTRGNVAHVLIKVTTNQNAGIMYNTRIGNIKFVFWWFIGCKHIIRNIGNEATIPNLNKEIVKNIAIHLPPLPEQTAIANYLDTKTQAIDKKIDLLSKKADTYKDLRKSLINETVCRGLDKNVLLKDSGIEWIGQIPKHWEVKRLKDILRRNDGGTWGDFSDTGTIVLRSTEINLDGSWNLDNPAKILLNEKEIKKSLLLNGDLLITKSSGSDIHIGKTALVNEEIENLICCYSNFMQRIRPKKSISSKLLYIYLNSSLARFQYNLLSKSTTGLGNLSAELINLITIVLPPSLEEQIAVANYLEEKTKQIDNILSNIQHQVNCLEELRKTLINDVVTGKMKVI